MKALCFPVTIGNMLAIADQTAIYLLEFINQGNIDARIKQFTSKMHIYRKERIEISYGLCPIITLVILEMQLYFQGLLSVFTVPICYSGTPFEVKAWQQLSQVSYGQLKTYAWQAKAMNACNSYRAVANANAANVLNIIIPCHRIIKSDGSLGGYNGLAERKLWLIEHEKKYSSGNDYDYR